MVSDIQLATVKELIVRHPSLRAPGEKELCGVMRGDFVRVYAKAPHDHVASELYWIVVESSSGDGVVGHISAGQALYGHLRMVPGDRIAFSKSHICEVISSCSPTVH